MPDLAGLLGVMPEFVWKDRTYRVHPRDLDLEGRYGKMTADDALDGILAHADRLGPELLGTQLEGWRHDKSARLFSYGGFLVQRALGTEDGQKLLAFLQLGKANPGVSRTLIDSIWKDKEKRRELLDRMNEASGEGPGPNEEPGPADSQAGPSQPSSEGAAG